MADLTQKKIVEALNVPKIWGNIFLWNALISVFYPQKKKRKWNSRYLELTIHLDIIKLYWNLIISLFKTVKAIRPCFGSSLQTHSCRPRLHRQIVSTKLHSYRAFVLVSPSVHLGRVSSDSRSLSCKGSCFFLWPLSFIRQWHGQLWWMWEETGRNFFFLLGKSGGRGGVQGLVRGSRWPPRLSALFKEHCGRSLESNKPDYTACGNLRPLGARLPILPHQDLMLKLKKKKKKLVRECSVGCRSRQDLSVFLTFSLFGTLAERTLPPSHDLSDSLRRVTPREGGSNTSVTRAAVTWSPPATVSPPVPRKPTGSDTRCPD